jgi:phenylpropionate dioxygenase-like ring-hydroxylating dioxygenase large terminal subunit
VNLDTRAAPLQPRVAAQEARFARHDVAAAVAVADYHAVWQGNWKLAVENASESYHHMGLHRATIEPYMPARGTFATAATDHYAEHVTPIVEAVAREYGIAYDTPTRLTAEDRAAMKVVTVFPNFVLLTVGDVVNWLVFTPLAVDRTEVRAGFLLPPAALAVEPDVAALRAGMQQSLETINGEDEQATALQQKAATSRFAARGALSPREAVLPQFYRYLARMLAPAEG